MGPIGVFLNTAGIAAVPDQLYRRDFCAGMRDYPEEPECSPGLRNATGPFSGDSLRRRRSLTVKGNSEGGTSRRDAGASCLNRNQIAGEDRYALASQGAVRNGRGAVVAA